MSKYNSLEDHKKQLIDVSTFLNRCMHYILSDDSDGLTTFIESIEKCAICLDPLQEYDDMTLQCKCKAKDITYDSQCTDKDQFDCRNNDKCEWVVIEKPFPNDAPTEITEGFGLSYTLNKTEFYTYTVENTNMNVEFEINECDVTECVGIKFKDGQIAPKFEDKDATANELTFTVRAKDKRDGSEKIQKIKLKILKNKGPVFYTGPVSYYSPTKITEGQTQSYL
jgi:hypothetical protein